MLTNSAQAPPQVAAQHGAPTQPAPAANRDTLPNEDLLEAIRAVGPDAQTSYAFARCFPELAPSAGPFTDLILRAAQYGDKVFDPAAALAAVDPPDMPALERVISDSCKEVQELGLAQTLARRQEHLRARGTVITPEAINTLAADSPNVERLLAVAGGVDIGDAMRSAGVPHSRGQAMQSGNTDCPEPVLLHHIRGLIENAKCLVLPRAFAIGEALKGGLPMAICRAFITGKEDSVLGRLITDYKQNLVNGRQSAKDQRTAEATGTYGEVTHASTPTICLSLSRCAERFGRENVHAEVDDVSGAYQRVLLGLGSATLGCIAVLIGGQEFVVITLVCMFGHYLSGFPWGTVAAEIQRQANDRARKAGIDFTSCLLYVDDYLRIAPDWFLRSDRSDFLRIAGSDTPGLAGANAISSKKSQSTVDATSRQFKYTGVIFDLDTWTLRLSAKRLARTINAFWLRLPPRPEAGMAVPSGDLQTVFSYAYQLATTSRASYLRYYANSLGNCLRGRSFANRWQPAYLTHCAVRAIEVLRRFTITAAQHPRVLNVPIELPLLLHPSEGETDDDLHERQEAAAKAVVYTDAATSTGGIGIYIPGIAWAYYQVPEQFRASPACTINVLELLGIVLGSSLAAFCLRHNDINASYLHIHRRSDSRVALAQLAKTNANTALALRLIHFEMQICAAHDLVPTQHHMEGLQNFVSDAVSRNLSTPRGEEARLLLTQCRQLFPSSTLCASLEALLTTSPDDAFSTRPLQITNFTTTSMWTFA